MSSSSTCMVDPASSAIEETMESHILRLVAVEAHSAKTGGAAALLSNIAALQKVGGYEILEEFQKSCDVVVAGLSARAAFQAAESSGAREPVADTDITPRAGVASECCTEQEQLEEKKRCRAWVKHLQLESAHLMCKERELRCLLFAEEENKKIAEATLVASKAVDELVSSMEECCGPDSGPDSAGWEQMQQSWANFGFEFSEEMSD